MIFTEDTLEERENRGEKITGKLKGQKGRRRKKRNKRE